MNKRQNDISQQIQKYFNGELDARAMHQLEREALNDPFLAEALEGYAQTDANQQKKLDDIQSLLQARVDESQRRVIPWRFLSIAASVLITVSIGGLLLFNHQPEHKAAKAVMVMPHKQPVSPAKPALPAINDTAKPVLIAENKPVMAKKGKSRTSNMTTTAGIAVMQAPGSANTNAINNELKQIPAQALAAAPMKRDTVNLREVAVVGYAAQKKAAVAASVTTIQSENLTLKDVNPVQNMLQGKVAGVSISPSKTRTVSGIVKDKEGSLPGVTVKIKGTNIGVVTDANGKFTLPAVHGRPMLELNYIGYVTKDVSVPITDSLVIAMVPNSNALSEVVVIGYGTKKNEDNEDEAKSARPARGWDDFEKYIKDNAVSPDDKTGVVKLSFMVNADNSLSDFKVLKSVSAPTDTAAIDLIKDGPTWLRNTNGKPEKVRVRIKFAKKN